MVEKNLEGIFSLGFNDVIKNLGISTTAIEPRDYAVFAGKCLAFLIANTDIFGDLLVSLIGFSTGSLVAYHCAYDLFRLGKLDKLMSISFVGSPLKISQMDPDLVLNLGGRIFNVFSHDDYLLRYLSVSESDQEEPIGLRQFDHSDFVDLDKISAELGKNTNLITNLDLSEWVKSHSEFKIQSFRILDFLYKTVPYNLFISRVKLTIS